MAFRSASTVVGISAASGVVSKPAGVVSGDRLVAICNSDGLNAAASTGWTSDVVQNITFDGGNFQVLTKVAGGSEPSTYTFTNVGLGDLVVVAFSGRAATALTIGTAGVSNAGNSSVISPAAPGITVPSAGDDLLYLAGLDQNTDEPWSSAGPAGFTTLVQGKVAGEFSAICLASLDNASAGATGTKTGTFTVDAGPGGAAGWAAVLISIPTAGAAVGLMGQACL